MEIGVEKNEPPFEVFHTRKRLWEEPPANHEPVRRRAIREVAHGEFDRCVRENPQMRLNVRRGSLGSDVPVVEAFGGVEAVGHLEEPGL